MMPRILDRLVARSFLRLFFIFVTAAPLLFILGDATENLDRYLDRGLTTGQVLLSYVYQYPMFMFWAFPIAALLAAVFTIQPMTVHREIMAAKAGGISFHRLVAPMIVLGVLFTGVGLALAEFVPKATQRAAEIRGERDRRQGWLSQFVYLTDAGESLMARRLTVQDGRMTGVILLREAENELDPIVHIVASEGVWDGTNGWSFRDGYVRELMPDGEERFRAFDEMEYERLTERPDDLVETVRDEDEMSRGELSVLAERVQRSGGDAGRLLVKREQRLAIPVATLVIILFGAPLATSSKRGGAAYGIGISLATTILYLVLFRVAGALGYAGTLDPLLAAWLPNGLFFVAGTVLMVKVRT